jgi:hypothetical protein
MSAIRTLWRSSGGATAAEFAMILPILILFIFGIIDVGRVMWAWNQAEKATQAGVRYAAATNLLPSGLASYDFAVSGGLSQGAAIPESLFGGVTCDSTGCTCRTGATCPPLGTFSTADFDLLVARIRSAHPDVTAANVRVDYDYSGLGYAGDPNGPDVIPLVTVWLSGMTFPSTLAFGAPIPMPQYRSTLTLEDGAGQRSN